MIIHILRKQPSKRKPSTLLDSMFADQADGKALKTEAEEKEHSLEESLTTKEPVLDLGGKENQALCLNLFWMPSEKQ